MKPVMARPNKNYLSFRFVFDKNIGEEFLKTFYSTFIFLRIVVYFIEV